jgi:Effector Associated Constant Component 1
MHEGSGHAEVRLSDPSQLGSLQEWLRAAVPSARVSRVPGRPGPGDLGAADVLAMVASSSSLVAVIKILPEFLRSRRTGLSVEMTVNGEPFTLTATNVDEVMPVLERLLDQAADG